MIRRFLKRLFCDHDFIFQCRLYGDQIVHCGGHRELFKCWKCDKYRYGRN